MERYRLAILAVKKIMATSAVARHREMAHHDRGRLPRIVTGDENMPTENGRHQYKSTIVKKSSVKGDGREEYDGISDENQRYEMKACASHLRNL